MTSNYKIKFEVKLTINISSSALIFGLASTEFITQRCNRFNVTITSSISKNVYNFGRNGLSTKKNLLKSNLSYHLIISSEIKSFVLEY